MAYVGKNPKFDSVIVKDEAGTPANPASGATKIITRSGAAYLRNSSGTETQLLTGSAAYLYSAKSSDYTVTDTDNIRTIGMTTSSTDRTVTLPTAADNTNRILTIKKVDSGTGKVTIDGEGAETIDGATTYILYLQYDAITLQCDGTGWFIVNKSLVLATEYIGIGGNGYGSTDTAVRRFSSNTDGTGGVSTTGASVAQYWTCIVPGMYECKFKDFRTSNQAALIITKNSTKTTSASLFTDTDSFVELYAFAPASGTTGEATCVVKCVAGDIIRFQGTGSTTTGDNCRGIIRMISRL